jgi:uncharacterized protein YbaP (TraB family)
MKKWLLAVFLIVPFMAIPAALATSPPKATTSLWQVSSAQRTIYIASDTQVLSADDYPLPRAFAQAFAASHALYVEQIPGTSTQSQDKIRALIGQLGTLPDGQALDDLLTPAQIDTVKAAAKKNGLPFSHFEHLRPWLLALALMSDPAQRTKLDLKPQQQLTSYFYRQARKRKIPTTPFESYADIFHIVSSMPTPVQVKWLVHVSQPDKTNKDNPENIHKLVAAWRQGDTASVAALSGSFKKVPKVRQTLVTARNHRWVQVLEGKLRRKGAPIFVVVGDGHLMHADNMLALLRRDGFQVSQL